MAKRFPFFIVFLILCIASSLPVLLFETFPTMDGPAHLYNARLLSEFWFEGNSVLQQAYSLNPELLPNYTGHALLAVLMHLGLPALYAEKVLLILITVGIPVSFYQLVKTYTQKTPQATVILVFPMVYTFVFGLGFFNFSLGLVFFFVSLSFWFKTLKYAKLYHFLGIFLAIGLCYFSHALCFVFLAITLFGLTLGRLLFSWKGQTFSLRDKAKNACIVFLLFVPFLVLFTQFYSGRGGSNSSSFLPLNELMQMLYGMRALVIYSFGREQPKLIIMAALLLLSTIFITYRSLKTREKTSYFSFVWLFLVILSLGLLFALPDASSGGSYVSQRISLFFFLFIILFINANHLSRKVATPVASLVLVLHFIMISSYIKSAGHLDGEAEKFRTAANYLEPNSTVLPIRTSNDWLDPHFSNYLGIDKPLVILENYEASNNYFPLMWNNQALPQYSVSDTASSTCIFWKTGEGAVAKPDYVVHWGDRIPDGCEAEILEIVKKNFEPVFSNETNTITVYKVLKK